MRKRAENQGETLKCANCGNEFPYRANKKYCSDRCRFRAWMTGKEDEEVEPCYYCGMPGGTIDHVPPQSIRPGLLKDGITRWEFVEVRACHECNSILSSQPPWTLGARKQKIKRKLADKYANYLEMPDWEDSELGRLGDVLGDYVASGVLMKEMLKKRLKW